VFRILEITFKLQGYKHLSDINHKFSLIIQSVFEKNDQLSDYTKKLSSIRAQKSISKIARIVPPNQRVMNLMPLFAWGKKMLYLMEMNELTEEEKATLSFLEPLKEFVLETYQILINMKKMQMLLKSKGFNNKTAKEAILMFSDIKTDNSLNITNLLCKFVI